MERNLEGLLFPGSVAVIGASGTPGKVGHALFANVAASFAGPVYNPKYTELLGRPCVASVEKLPEPVDLAVVVVPAEHVAGVLKSCGERGIRNVVVVSAGFKEAGEEGAKRERELVEIAQRYGLNVLGPNVLGLISTRVGLNATFAPRSVRGVLHLGVGLGLARGPGVFALFVPGEQGRTHGGGFPFRLCPRSPDPGDRGLP